MSRTIKSGLVAALGVVVILAGSAHASPNCLRDQKPFALSNDTMAWTMFAAPGSECIQGLRWSFMQISSVSVAKAPTKGKIVMVGPGFRYFADSEKYETDSFTLVVEGKNRGVAGQSTLEIVVKPAPAADTVVSELPQRP